MGKGIQAAVASTLYIPPHSSKGLLSFASGPPAVPTQPPALGLLPPPSPVPQRRPHLHPGLTSTAPQQMPKGRMHHSTALAPPHLSASSPTTSNPLSCSLASVPCHRCSEGLEVLGASLTLGLLQVPAQKSPLL